MPNHVSNTLIIEGDYDERQRFVDFAKGENWHDYEEVPLDFNKFIPYPQEFLERDIDYAEHDKIEMKMKDRVALTEEETQKLILFKIKYGDDYKDGFNSGGYDWCSANWDTKWNAYEIYLTHNKDETFYGFETAWSPPLNVIKKMGEMFPKLKITNKYSEENYGFEGEFICENGKVIQNKEWEPEAEPDN